MRLEERKVFLSKHFWHINSILMNTNNIIPRHRNVGSPAYWVGIAGARSLGSIYGQFSSTVWQTLRHGRIFRRTVSDFRRDLPKSMH